MCCANLGPRSSTLHVAAHMGTHGSALGMWWHACNPTAAQARRRGRLAWNLSTAQIRPAEQVRNNYRSKPIELYTGGRIPILITSGQEQRHFTSTFLCICSVNSINTCPSSVVAKERHFALQCTFYAGFGINKQNGLYNYQPLGFCYWCCHNRLGCVWPECHKFGKPDEVKEPVETCREIFCHSSEGSEPWEWSSKSPASLNELCWPTYECFSSTHIKKKIMRIYHDSLTLSNSSVTMTTLARKRAYKLTTICMHSAHWYQYQMT